MSPIRRIAAMVVASTTAAGLIAAVDLAPPATAATCDAPEANIDPPATVPLPPPGVAGPAPGQLQVPTGRRPRGANERAPLPKLGPLISALLRPGARQYSAPVEHQAGVVPPAPAPPGVAAQPQPNAAQVPPPDAAAAQQPAPPPVSIAGAPTSLVEWVTGPNSPNKTLERFSISGTDLGIPWDNGDAANRQVLLAFGDTFGYCRLHGEQWRNNVLLRSQDQNLSDGILVGPGVVGNKYSGSPVLVSGVSRAILPGVKWATHQSGMIPTAAISVGGKQYMNFMSIKDWGRDGEWSTNYSAIAVSPDNGEHWGIYPGSVRTADDGSVPGARHVPGNENFQMGAFMRGNDGYLYSFGTPSGRGGSAYLARVPQGSIPDLTKYQYWHDADGQQGWVPANPGAATPVIPGPIGEMSATYHPYLKQYLALYCNGNNDVVARTAPAPQGPWSPEQPLVSSWQFPGGIYAPYIHPWSSGKDLYFTLSSWNAYDVMLVHTELP